MGKLVLFLKDASPVEIPLGKERVTIGRRPDNDVCLPTPAVSGDHAAVVTILDDSFLEDLGSTNGTLVNGRPIAKHFLRDRDQIDIGRQLLVYLTDDGAKADPPAGLASREDRRELLQQVEGARRPARGIVPALSPVDEDLSADLRPRGPEAPRADARMPPRQAARFPGFATPASAPTLNDLTFDAELAAIRQARPESAGPAVDAPEPVSGASTGVRARLRVLSGPAAGRVVAIARDDFVIGRIGAQVAAIEWRGGVLVLVPREGSSPPTVNGEPVPVEGRRIAPGDGLEVAGTRLELLSAE